MRFFRGGSDNIDILIYLWVFHSSHEYELNTLVTNIKATIKLIHEFDTEVV